MCKSNLATLTIGLLICLIGFLALLPSTAYASFPLGLTLTPTPTEEPPTLTPPPPTDTPLPPTNTPPPPTNTPPPPTNTPPPPTDTPVVPTATPTTIVKPPPSTPTPTALPPTPEPEEPKEPKPTREPVLLPQTGDYPADSPGFGSNWLGLLAIPLLAVAAGLALGIRIGPKLRKWRG